MQQAQQLERLASDLHAVAFDFAEPARSLQFAERRIAEVERICAEARAVVRGRGR
jgi:cob(I)alamin adenosyltransferase